METTAFNIPFYSGEIKGHYMASPIWEGAAIKHPEWVLATPHGLAFIQDLSGPEPKLVKAMDFLRVVFACRESTLARKAHAQSVVSSLLNGVYVDQGAVRTYLNYSITQQVDGLPDLKHAEVSDAFENMAGLEVRQQYVDVDIHYENIRAKLCFCIVFAEYNRVLNITYKVFWEKKYPENPIRQPLLDILTTQAQKYVELRPKVVYDFI